MISGGRSDGFRQKSLAQKAEEMRAQKIAYEAARSKLDITLKLGRSFDKTSFAFTEKEEAITRAVRRPAYDEAEKLANALDQEAQDLLKQRLTEKIQAVQGRIQQLAADSHPATEEQAARATKLPQTLADGKLEDAINEVGLLEAELGKSEEGALVGLGEQVDSVLKWAVPPEAEADVRKALAPCIEFVEKRDLAGATKSFEETLRTAAPQILEKLSGLAKDLAQIVPIAKGLGVNVEEAERLLQKTASPSILTADKLGASITVLRGPIETKAKDELRSRLLLLKEVLAKAAALSGGAGEAPHDLEGLLVEADRLPLIEGSPLLARAQGLIEAPVLKVVFEQLEETRAYVEEARELERETGPALEKIREVRNSIRDKDFAKCLALAAEALDVARNAVEDAEVARTELEEYKSLLGRLQSGGLDATHFQSFVERAERAIREHDFTLARAVLREAIRAVGKESSQYLGEQLERIERTLTLLAERHWVYPEDLSARIEEANLLLSSARLTEAADVISDITVQVKETVAAPLQSRISELEGTVEVIADAEARKSATNLIGSIKSAQGGDPLLWLEKLTGAEREINVVLASEVGRIVADLDDSLTRLQKMGIPVEDQTREIVRVREIFDVGDYQRASKSGVELLSSMHQLATAKAEESISEAKLALAEVSKSVPEPTTVKELLEAARTSLQSSNPLEALESAQRAIATARKIQSSSQTIIDRISQIVNQMTSLRRKGATPEEIRIITGKIADVRTAYQSLAFDTAESTIVEILDQVDRLSTKMDLRTLAATLKGTLDGIGSLGLPEGDWLSRVEALLKEGEEGPPRGPKERMDALTEEILGKLRPSLEQEVTTLDGELRLAREQGLETREPDGLLAEVKSRMAEKFPTGVVRAITQIRQQFFQSKGFQETANKALSDARELVNQADLMRLDTKPLSPRTAKAEDQLHAGNYGAVLETALAIKEEARDMVRAHLNQVLSDLQGMINRAKREGALTMVAENYLAKARGLVNSNTPMEVLQLVTQAENEIEKVELQYSIAQNSLQTLTTKVSEATQSGLVIPEITADVASARQAFEGGEYAQLLEIVLRANDQLQVATSQRGRLKEDRVKLEPLRGALGRLSLERADFEALLRTSDELEGQGKYVEADTATRTAYEKARTLFDADLTAKLEALRTVIDFFNDEPDPASAFNKTTLEVRQARAKEDWEGTLRTAEEVQATASRRFESSLASERDRIGPLAEILSKAELEGFEAQVHRITDLITKRSFVEATAASKEFHQAVSQALSAFIDRTMELLEKGARLAEKIGADGTPIAEGMTDVRTLLRQDTPDAAVHRVLEIRGKLDELLTGPLRTRFQEVTRNVNLARDGFNVSVQGLPERLQGAEELRNKGDLIGATQEVLAIAQEVTRRKGWQKELVDLHYLIDTLIGQSEEAHKPTEHPSALLQESIASKATGDYAKAIAVAGEAVKELKASLGPDPEKKE